MKIIESRIVPVSGHASVYFIRIDPEDITDTLSSIIQKLMDLSWLNSFDKDYIKLGFKQRASITISDIKDKFSKCDNGTVTKDAGEYIVSELSRESIISELNYLNIPLGELLGKKTSGNPGFDFHSQNQITETVIFGEAKYSSTHSAYPSAINQINDFINDKKDISDIPDLTPFCSQNSLDRASKGQKGFAAAFSAKSTASDKILISILSSDSFKSLLNYEEVILVAVNL